MQSAGGWSARRCVPWADITSRCSVSSYSGTQSPVLNTPSPSPHHPVRHPPAHRAQPVVLPGRVDPVGQKHDHQVPGGIHPDGRPGEAGMAEASGPTAWFRRCSPRTGCPSRGPGWSRGGGSVAGGTPGRPTEKSPASVGIPGTGRAARRPVRPPARLLQQPLAEGQQVRGRAEESRVTGYASQPGGVLVVDLAPENAAAPGVVLCRRYAGEPVGRAGGSGSWPCPAGGKPVRPPGNRSGRRVRARPPG